ncbi:hypothetical protein NHX12_022120 [Muraenolepis orangiensis]|uniref:Uncharacterized protein n=1 Tax=Muraenolepis orangiensis TaxID=630683 RepID=A0A9Q0EN27_9TELE|nr:hypothetical protein NHX12_022120 [Muraenolepis orangiensis]
MLVDYAAAKASMKGSPPWRAVPRGGQSPVKGSPPWRAVPRGGQSPVEGSPPWRAVPRGGQSPVEGSPPWRAVRRGPPQLPWPHALLKRRSSGWRRSGPYSNMLTQLCGGERLLLRSTMERTGMS